MNDVSGRRRSSHAPSLRVLVRRAVVEHRLVEPGLRVLVACSGGPDSTALLHALSMLRDELGFDLVAHGVDHGLRAEAVLELDRVRTLALAIEVPFDTTRVDVSPGGNLQARARTVRHAALREAAARAGAVRIATGHTADDRAETLLMRLVRGTGLRGLAVIPPSAGELIRPLFRARRADVLLHVARHGLVCSNDPSNESTRFLRTRVRREVLPLLETLSPKVVEALCSLADAAGELDDDPLAELGRAQRTALVRALRLGHKTARVWLPDGVEAVLELSSSVEPDATSRGRPRKKKPLP